MIKTGSDFSGVGAFDQALKRLGIEYQTEYACDWDKYARQTYIENYGEPKYYPEDVYDRKIPEDSLDIYITSPPCQSFSLAGKRKGEEDKRGILFYNSHEFIVKNNPRYFIFENVKGLLSDANGVTFQNWVAMLGGKSVNGTPILFPLDSATPYHIYYKVLNAKDYGVPQNRERIFIIGIRDDIDNHFRWPKPMHLSKRLKDVLDEDVDEKYYLSEKMVNGLTNHRKKRGSTNNFPIDVDKPCPCITARYFKMGAEDPYVKVTIGAIRGRNIDDPKSREPGLPTEQRLEINETNVSNSLTTVQKDNVVIQLNESKESNGAQPYKQNRLYDTDGISPVLDTECRRPKYMMDYKIRRLTPRECFRLMDFPEDFKIKQVSETQAYKQAGNSIVVAVLAKIIERLHL